MSRSKYWAPPGGYWVGKTENLAAVFGHLRILIAELDVEDEGTLILTVDNSRDAWFLEVNGAIRCEERIGETFESEGITVRSWSADNAPGIDSILDSSDPLSLIVRCPDMCNATGRSSTLGVLEDQRRIDSGEGPFRMELYRMMPKEEAFPDFVGGGTFQNDEAWPSAYGILCQMGFDPEERVVLHVSYPARSATVDVYLYDNGETFELGPVGEVRNAITYASLRMAA